MIFGIVTLAAGLGIGFAAGWFATRRAGGEPSVGAAVDPDVLAFLRENYRRTRAPGVRALLKVAKILEADDVSH